MQSKNKASSIGSKNVENPIKNLKSYDSYKAIYVNYIYGNYSYV